MKRFSIYMVMFTIFILSAPAESWAQAASTNLVNVTSLKVKWPEKGSLSARDSLIAIYNDNVVRKNDKILSHREYSHYYTGNSQDYLIVEEYLDMASMDAAAEISSELEKKAWPDAMKRKEFMDAMGAYFENWHGDALYHSNPKLNKN